MDHPKWDLKTNYMLACSVSKYGLNPERWDLVANELSNYIQITAQVGMKRKELRGYESEGIFQGCQHQFDVLCEQYGRDW